MMVTLTLNMLTYENQQFECKRQEGNDWKELCMICVVAIWEYNVVVMMHVVPITYELFLECMETSVSVGCCVFSLQI